MRRLAPALAALVAAVVLSSCSGGDDQLTAYATVDDVADMTEGAPVMLADVTVGSVAGISLGDDHRARLRLEVDRSAKVPAAVTARVRRTSVIGEKFVELRPAPDVGEGAPLLEDGATIERTEVVPDLEQLISSGTDLFGAVASRELAMLLSESAIGFGDRGPQLRRLLEGLDTTIGGYAARTGTIERLVRAIDQLAADTAPAARAHGEALANLAEATRILAEQRDAFVDLLASLRDLSVAGRSILDEHLETIQRQFASLRVLTGVLAERQEDLGRLLVNLPRHNRSLMLAVSEDDFAQVLNDVILCGVPGGGEDPDSPTDACRKVEQEPRG